MAMFQQFHSSGKRDLFMCSITCFTSSALMPTLRLQAKYSFTDRSSAFTHSARFIGNASFGWLSSNALSSNCAGVIKPQCTHLWGPPCFNLHSSVFSKEMATPSRFTTVTSEWTPRFFKSMIFAKSPGLLLSQNSATQSCGEATNARVWRNPSDSNADLDSSYLAGSLQACVVISVKDILCGIFARTLSLNL